MPHLMGDAGLERRDDAHSIAGKRADQARSILSDKRPFVTRCGPVSPRIRSHAERGVRRTVRRCAGAAARAPQLSRVTATSTLWTLLFAPISVLRPGFSTFTLAACA